MMMIDMSLRMQDEVNRAHSPLGRHVRLALPLSRYPSLHVYRATLLYVVPDSVLTRPLSKSSRGPQSATITIIVNNVWI